MRARGYLACAFVLAGIACAAQPVAGPRASAPATRPSATSSSPASSSASPPPLAALRIDDQPHRAGYRRDDWPVWKDIDGDGCDAREQALVAASNPPAQTTSGCKVVSGAWHSDYDGRDFDSSAAVDIDHVVPLENAHESGGWQWSTDQRAQFANDQAELWVASAAANRSKGAKGPDQWRPEVKEVWCKYATRWVAIKVTWDLTATTEERDALGQMLDTCPAT